MIEGVELKELTRHPMGERGYFFEEVIRVSDDFFREGFGQWSRTKMHTGLIKGFHIHQKQTDWWLVESGLVKAVVCDLRVEGFGMDDWQALRHYPVKAERIQEFLLGDDQPPIVLKIPPGVAHGLKVLQGPATLSYITSETYNPQDEGRIPFDALGYDWHKVEIK